jgi:ribosomal protein S18 acetylase RimI-like enzyme
MPAMTTKAAIMVRPWLRDDLKGLMSDSVALRTAVAGDAVSLAATIAAAFEQYRGRLTPESGAFRETADGISRELADGAGAIVAEQDGEALGCVMIRPVEGDLYFGRLAVVPSARGRGIARRLVAAVEAEAVRRGLAGVRLGVRIALTENQRLFTALGYVETSREAHPGFDQPTSITMRKSLRSQLADDARDFSRARPPATR